MALNKYSNADQGYIREVVVKRLERRVTRHPRSWNVQRLLIDRVYVASNQVIGAVCEAADVRK